MHWQCKTANVPRLQSHFRFQARLSDPSWKAMRRTDPSAIQQYLKSNAEAASNLAGLVKDFVEYGKTRTTLEAYERKLEVPR
jgi:hypothetical protein